jgi:hypothetical protein
MSEYRIIVARYNEDVSWTKKYNCVVYNKGMDEIEGSIRLDNVGRESHSYLRHIITNYHNLDETLVFLQGNPLQHPINFNSLFDIEEVGYSDKIQNLSPDRWGEHMSNKEDFTISEWNGKIANPKGYKLGEWWERTTGEPYKRSPMVFWNALFSVKKEFVLKRNLESYISIYKTLLHSSNPVEGHYCERTWFNIFNLC